MQIFSFGTGATLALSGVGIAVFGILDGGFKPTAIGLVLVFGAGVFATLYVGSRRGKTDSPTNAPSLPPRPGNPIDQSAVR
jgi:hypothetical protein